MGVDDQGYINNLALDLGTLQSRYSALQQQLAPSVHRYNTYWNSFEASGQPASDQPLDCPSDYTLVPADPSGLVANGGAYNQFRCMNTALALQFQAQLAVDQQQGMQSAAIIWCAPPIYRDPACLGMPQGAIESVPENYSTSYQLYQDVLSGKKIQTQAQVESVLEPSPLSGNVTLGSITESALDASGCSCVPTDAAMPGLADFVRYLGDYINTPNGRFSSYIVWNEVANSVWTDMSPRIDTTVAVTPQAAAIWVSVYSNMVTLVHNAAQAPALIYVSTDRWWGVPPVLTEWNIGRCHMGTENLLLGVWQTLGVSIDWSLVLHVYGGVNDQEFNGENGIVDAYGFATLTDVAAWQKQQLAAAIAATPSTTYTVDTAPHRFLAASEQGWQQSLVDTPTRAQYICQSYNYVKGVPTLLWVSYNDFQDWGGDDWGLIPSSVNAEFDGGPGSPTYQAIVAANPNTWGVDPTNYCCVTWQVGCP